MRVLGIDSATARASVGLWIDGSVRSEQSTSSRNHAASLLPLIDAVLRAGATDISGVDLIAVSAGPGSFSGLRVGVSVAKGLALAIGVSVVAVSTLEALAATVTHHDGAVCAILDAFKGELYFGRFQAEHEQLTRVGEDVVVTPEHAAQMVPPAAVVLGDGVERYAEVFNAHLTDSVTVLPFPEYGPSGGTVAHLGAARFERRCGVPAADLEPLYIRPPEVRVNI